MANVESVKVQIDAGIELLTGQPNLGTLSTEEPVQGVTRHCHFYE